MKSRTLFCSTLVCSLAFVAGRTNGGAADSSSDIPRLRKQGAATQLIVDGKPFLALAGELSNNSATSIENMKPIWLRLVAQSNLNTVLAGVSWAQIEPQEGKFDFTVLDGVIREARNHNMRLVLLWFASWKNALSSYPPYWVKKDFERFPRVQIAGGKAIELLTPFSDANRDADAAAFAALMRHVKQVDGGKHTVIMIQVENEVGIVGDSRDRSPAANQAFAGPAPKDLMDYLQQHKNTLAPELSAAWGSNGFKTSGTWEQVFGPGRPESVPPIPESERANAWHKLWWPVDEIFMAWRYSMFVNKVAAAGKAEYNIPMYVNTWLQEPQNPQPGNFPSGCSEPEVHDIWRFGAPSIDLLAPDLYVPTFAETCERFTRNGNPLFIPETRNQMFARALYAFGRHDAIGLSVMGIERSATPDTELINCYDMITQLAPLITEHQGKGTMSAVLLGPDDPPQKVPLGNYTLNVTYARPRVAAAAAASPQQTLPSSGAIFIATGPDEYYMAGNSVNVTFSPNTPGPGQAGLGIVEEGKFVKGSWVPGCLLAGDDTGEGQNISLRNTAIQRVVLYRFP
jgi:hypothetical protein